MNFGFFISSDWSVYFNSFIYGRLRQNRRSHQRQSLGTRLRNHGSHTHAKGQSIIQLFLKVQYLPYNCTEDVVLTLIVRVFERRLI